MSAALSLPKDDGKLHLTVLSQSEVACFRRCAREYLFRYVLRRRPRRSSEALRFGTFFHLGLNEWHADAGDPQSKLEAAITAVRARAESSSDDSNPFDLVKAEELLLGYTARWGESDCAEYETIAVEREFRMPMVNPETGAASRTFELGGKIDAIIRRRSTGQLRVKEHKTTSDDISLGSDYWRQVSATDPQVSTYLPGARAANFDVEDCLYDVVRKVALRPYRATPLEKRKYTKEKSKQCPFCKKTANVPGPHRVNAEVDGDPVYCVDGKIITEPGGKLHDSQHEEDETPEEYRLRVRDDITEKPEKYFARGPIVRLKQDEAEHAADVWQTAWFIREARNAGRFPRSPNACRRYNRFCDYFDVCSGMASIQDDGRFRTAKSAHEELGEGKEI